MIVRQRPLTSSFYARPILDIAVSAARSARRRPYLVLLCLTTCAAFIYYAWGINSWKFAFVGDDWQFYAFARAIAQGATRVNPFDMHGVYGYNGVLGSLYQAAFLRVLGPSNSAWRLSNIILIAPISIFFYLWLRESFTKRIALLSTLILQASCFLANYLKLGYINAQSFALFVVALYLAAQLGQRPSVRNAMLLGAVLGVSFYIYIGPIFPILIAAYALQPLFTRRYAPARLAQLAGCGLLAYIAVAVWGIISATQLSSAARDVTVLGSQPRSIGQIAVAIAHNFLLFYHNYDYYFNHYIAGPYLDVLSGLLALGGIVLALSRWRSGPHLRLTLTYVIVVVVIALTSPYPYAATTRGIFFIPFGAAFAGLGLDALLRLPMPHARASSLKATLAAALLIVIWGLNIYQSQVSVFESAGYSATALVVRSMQHEARYAHPRLLVLIVSATYPYHGYYEDDRYLPMLQQAYGLQNIRITVVEPEHLQCGMLRGAHALYFRQDGVTAAAVRGLLACPDATYTADALTPAYPL